MHNFVYALKMVYFSYARMGNTSSNCLIICFRSRSYNS